MSEDIKNQVDLIIDNIYNYDIVKVMNLVEFLLKSIDIFMENNEFENINQLNDFLIMMEKAMNNKDYLLLADLLKFELIPIIPNKYLN